MDRITSTLPGGYADRDDTLKQIEISDVTSRKIAKPR